MILNTNLIHLILSAPQQDSFWNSQFEKAIRDIHSKVEFPITDGVKEIIKELGDHPPKKMSVKLKQEYNRKIKLKGIDDQIQIEHMISIKKLINGIWLLKKENSNLSSEMIWSYIVENTDCVYKLTKKEKGIHG